MQEKIVEQVEEILENKNNKINLNDENLKKFEETSKWFDEMVKKGWAKKKGNTNYNPLNDSLPLEKNNFRTDNLMR